MFGSEWRWDEEKYSVFLCFGVALTNAHVMSNSLRKRDGDHFKSILVLLISIGSSTAQKRASDQKGFKKRHKRRLSEQMASGETESPEIL